MNESFINLIEFWFPLYRNRNERNLLVCIVNIVEHVFSICNDTFEMLYRDAYSYYTTIWSGFGCFSCMIFDYFVNEMKSH